MGGPRGFLKPWGGSCSSIGKNVGPEGPIGIHRASPNSFQLGDGVDAPMYKTNSCHSFFLVFYAAKTSSQETRAKTRDVALKYFLLLKIKIWLVSAERPQAPR